MKRLQTENMSFLPFPKGWKVFRIVLIHIKLEDTIANIFSIFFLSPCNYHVLSIREVL